ncbi:MAG: OmpA family protein [Bacteroidota bacterium]|nr:OmpA family protein [Bacteroidota bacterium]
MHLHSCKKFLSVIPVVFFLLLKVDVVSAQTNFLLNGNFEDINTCIEYNAECGVEAWFYLKDIKAQMLANDDSVSSLGNNSFGLFFNWIGYKGFSPIIGTILPCRLKKDTRYTFKGMLKVRINGGLVFKPGVVAGEKFYVPNRPFSAGMHPDSIVQITPVPHSNFYQFEYSFVADGTEKYLTFGTFIREDATVGKKAIIGAQGVALVLDNFQLLSANDNETACNDFMKNKEKIYNYNFRHKEMDYSLYGKGELTIPFDNTDSNYITRTEIPKPPGKKPAPADTLKLGDVFFDFNKANLKPEALKMLEAYFKTGRQEKPIDSIYVEGHTDSIGTDNRNMQLSLQRCESVENWLQQNNILTRDRVQIHPFGKTRPVASNSTPQGRALNRRVEVVIFRETKE